MPEQLDPAQLVKLERDLERLAERAHAYLKPYLNKYGKLDTERRAEWPAGISDLERATDQMGHAAVNIARAVERAAAEAVRRA